MGRPERPIDAAAGPVAAFACDLRKLRAAAGNSIYREMARVALFSPSVLSSAASGHRLPTLQVALAFVQACGGDRSEWELRWHAVAGRTAVVPVPRQPIAQASRTGSGEAGWIAVADPVDVLPPPAQLPMGPTELVGRDAELAIGRQLLAPSVGGSAPLVISGPAGVGKTAFALRLANELAADLPDGQLYADLDADEPGADSPDRIAEGFLRALGVPPTLIPVDRTQRTGLCRSLLARRRVVVLLDGACSERQLRPLLSQGPHCRVLVTSCARLLGLDGVRRMELGVLPRAGSMAMMGVLAGGKRMQAERAAGGRLAELCGDLPLALNIVGKRIAAAPERTIADVTRQLADRPRLLDRLHVGDVSLRERFGTAHEGLEPLARLAFHRLGQDSAKRVTPYGMARTLQISVVSAEDVLESLVDAGLLQRATIVGQYLVPPLAWLFAAERPDPRRRPVGVFMTARPVARATG